MRYICDPHNIPLSEIEGTISVIIPCYNSAKYVGRCLDSVLSQTIGLEHLEIIVINDCSTDNTAEILGEYEKKYNENICLINLDENVGQGRARNIGLSYASGNYITFVDSDDAIASDMLEKLYAPACHFRCDYSDCGFEPFYGDFPTDTGKENDTGYLDIIESLDDKRAFFANNAFINSPWMRLFSREFLLENDFICFPEGTFMEDIYFFYMVLAKAKTVYHVPLKLYFYFQNFEGVMLSEKFNDYYMDIHHVFAMAVDKYEELGIKDQLKEELAFVYYNKVLKYLVDYTKKEFGHVDSENHRIMRDYLSKLYPNMQNNKYLSEEDRKDIGKYMAGRKIIAITHSLNRTGAPLVFFDMVRILAGQENLVDVIAMEEGPLRDEYEKNGYDIRVADDFLENLPSWQETFLQYDLAIVNTVVGIEAIYALNTTSVPTIWWIHEPEYWFQYYQSIFPKPEELHENVHVYGVSPITNELIEKYCGYHTGLLPFGIYDSADVVSVNEKADNDSISFVLPGTISNVKGQDLLCEAIKLLPDEIRKQCKFTVFGNQNEGEPEYYALIKDYAKEFDELELKAGIPHDEALAQIAKADYLLAPSRMEPFPTTAVEALMVSTVPIVSSACGVNYFLERDHDSMVFDSENADDLCQVITKAVHIRKEQENEYKRLCANARKTYEKQFSMEVFSDNIETILKKALGEKTMIFENKNSADSVDDHYPMIVYDHPEEYAGRGLRVFKNAAEFCRADSLSEEDLKWLSTDYDVLYFDRNQDIREGFAEIFMDPYYREKLSPKQMVDAVCQEENESSEDELTIEDRLKYLSPDTYKEYEKLGDELVSANVDQAFLCYENAEYLCDDDNEKERISNKKKELSDTGRVKVKKAAFVILSYNNKYLMQRCIESIYTNCNPESYSLIIFDNNSSDGVAQWLAEWGESNDEAIVALSEENLGFSGGCNAAAEYAPEGEDIFLLNNDTRVPANALFWLRMGLYSSHDVGAAGSIQNYFDSTKDESVNFSVIEKYMEYGAKKNVYTEGALEEQSKLCGFALLIRRNVWEEIGGLDEQFNPGYLEDDDICLGIIKLGYKLMMVHNSFIYHVGSQSFIKRNDLDELYIAHRKLLIEKWGFDNVYYSAVMKEQLEFIDSLSDKGYTRDSSFSVLHINCGCANMLGHIKYLYPNAELVGVEESDIIRKYAVSCIKVYGSVRELPKNVDEYDEVFRSE